ncbi:MULTISPECIES: hypothetical protein [unclassified Streptomyces]|uniref:hypothetical protein n=1 Tax=unclassified Streptomyces TaxID=2593676 RepID=UPI0036E02664
MAFPQTPLDVRVEAQIGTTWTDITTDSYTRSPIGIEVGRSEEASRTNPSKLSIEINNRSGKYSPRNPRSPYYGLIGRNTPIRVSVKGSESYLALDGTAAATATTPDTAALDITGDIDVRIEAELDWNALQTQILIGKWDTTGNQRSWMLHMQQGNLTFRWSPTGSASVFASATMPALPRRCALRATLDVDNGAGGFTARLYWATSLAGPWTQVGGDLTGVGVTSLFNSTAPLSIAPNTLTITPPWLPAAGRVYRAEVRSGIGGSAVAAPDFRALTEGTSSFADSTGKTWTVNAPARVSDREYRFRGDIAAWPARWDVSGEDRWVSVEAAGLLRRLRQGTKPLDSTLRRRIPSGNPVAYWPLEEGANATRAPASAPGIPAAGYSGLDWATADTLPGSNPLPKLKNPASLRAQVPASATPGWHVECVYQLPTMPAAQTEILRVTVAGSAMRTAVVYASTAGIRIEARDAADTVLAFFLYTNPPAIADFTGVWNRLSIFTSDAGGGNTNLTAAWRDITNSGGYWLSSTVYAGTQGSVTQIAGTWGAATEGMGLGHLAAFAVPGTGLTAGVSIFESADDGFDGEQASARMLRLASEESATVALSYVKGGTTQALGPQLPAPLLDLLEAAADTDLGILAEGVGDNRLTYRDRWTLYNQTPVLTLDYTAEGEIGPPFEPTEDDQKSRNDITVTRDGGSSGRAVLEDGALSVQAPPNGIGLYNEQFTLNLHEDEQAEPIAAWRLHMGTWDEARFPSVRLMLHAAPHLIPAYLKLRVGDRIRITNPPPELPPGPVDLIVQGWSEVLDQLSWDVNLVCTPAGPWTVGVVGDPVLGRIATDGTTLGTGVSSSATSLTLVSSPGPRWVDSATYPSRFPLDVLVGGELIRITSITGTSLTQTAVGIRGVNGISKSHAAGAKVQVATPAIVAL